MSNAHKAPTISEFKKLLKEHHLKATPQRLAVHHAMLKLGHASADMVRDEIFEHSQTKVTVASVYNILTNLSDIGIYHHRMSATNKMYFDVNTFKHIHIYDILNNTYKDFIDDELISLVEERLMNNHFKGYNIEGIDIQIICKPIESK